jgi:hypothetical protein
LAGLGAAFDPKQARRECPRRLPLPEMEEERLDTAIYLKQINNVGAFVFLRGSAKGIEPSYAAWEAAVLPLNYARKSLK